MKIGSNYPARIAQHEDRLLQAQYWYDIGGWGISPDMLFLTGFWPESMMKMLKKDGIDTSQAVEQVFGGILKFRAPPGKAGREELRLVLDELNDILQLRRYAAEEASNIEHLLREEWNNDPLSDLLPSDLDDDILRRIRSGKKRYVIAEDAATVRTLLRAYQLFKNLAENIGYYPGIYKHANGMFQLMVVEAMGFAQNNMSLRDPQEPSWVELEDIASTVDDLENDGWFKKHER